MKGIGMLIGYLFAFSVARLLGADAWGNFSLALSLITFGAILSVTGFDTLLMKLFSSQNKNQDLSIVYKRAAVIVISLAILFTAIVYLAAGTIADGLFNNPGLTPSFRIAAFAIFPFAVMSMNAGVLQGIKEIRSFVFIRFISHHLGALVLFLALLPFWGNNQVVVIAYTVSLYLIAGLTIILLYRKGYRFFSIQQEVYQPQKIRSLLRQSLPFLFIASLFFIKGWIDTIMVGIFMTESDVGIYNIALKLSGVLLIMVSAVNAIAAPKFSESFSDNKMAELKGSLRYSSAILFYTTLPLFLLLMLFPEQILSVFGEEFRAGRLSLVILSIGSFISAICGTTSYFLQMTGNQVAMQNITFVTVILGVILNLVLIPPFGIQGAAIATAAAMLFWNAVGVLFVRRKYNCKTYFSFFK